MTEDDAGVVDVAVTFGVLGGVLSAVYAFGVASGGPGIDVPLPLLVAAGTVVPAAVAPVVWRAGVDGTDWWSRPGRGAIAGTLTAWLSFSLAVPVVVVLGQATPPTTTAGAEVLAVVALAATVGTAFVGVVFLPVGALAGYALGR